MADRDAARTDGLCSSPFRDQGLAVARGSELFNLVQEKIVARCYAHYGVLKKCLWGLASVRVSGNTDL